MKMQKRQFRIGELAAHLGVEKFVIRFWEKEFKVGSQRSQGGQRFYIENDLETFKTIKVLLYDQGFTIAGAKKQLKKHTPQILASQRTTLDESTESDFFETLRAYKDKLLQIRATLS